jgi:iron(III) transport system permease protein
MRGLGSEFEDAARVHGAGRLLTIRTVLPIIAPALLSAFVISFAEAMSDFGVAFTLGTNAHFPIATYTLFNAIYSFPANFPVAAVIAAVLILSTVPPVFLQARVMRGRSYAVLSGRSKAVRRHQFDPLVRVGITAGLGIFMFFVLGLPLLGAVTSSFTNTDSFITSTGIHWTLQSYKDVFQPLPSFTTLGPPLWTSNQLGFWVASGTLILAFVLARRMASRTPGLGQRITDVFLLGSVAIPGIVLGVGYIFFYDQNFITSHVVDLYETMPLLIMGLIASAVPSQARLLTGPVGQIQSSLTEAARVHGATRWRAFRSTSVPLLSRALVWAWLLTFTKTISELAVSQILYQPGHEPASVVIETYLGTIFAPIGSAATVITLVEMVGVIGVVLLIFRLVMPKGWRRIGEAGVRS